MRWHQGTFPRAWTLVLVIWSAACQVSDGHALTATLLIDGDFSFWMYSNPEGLWIWTTSGEKGETILLHLALSTSSTGHISCTLQLYTELSSACRLDLLQLGKWSLIQDYQWISIDLSMEPDTVSIP